MAVGSRRLTLLQLETHDCRWPTHEIQGRPAAGSLLLSGARGAEQQIDKSIFKRYCYQNQADALTACAT